MTQDNVLHLVESETDSCNYVLKLALQCPNCGKETVVFGNELFGGQPAWVEDSRFAAVICLCSHCNYSMGLHLVLPECPL